MFEKLRLKNLRIWQKLALIVLLMGSSLPILFNFIRSSDEATTGLAKSEVVGTEYYASMWKLLQFAIEYRDAAEMTRSQLDKSSEMRELESKIDAQLASVDSTDKRLRDSLVDTTQASTRMISDLRSAWVGIKASNAGDSAESERFVDAILALFNTIGDKSQLILDPELDTYYLMALTTYNGPGLLSDLGKLRTKAAILATHDSADTAAVAEIGKLLGAIKLNRDAIQVGMASGMVWNEEHEDHSLSSALSGHTAAFVSEIALWDSRVSTAPAGNEQKFSSDIYKDGTTSLNQGFAYYASALENLKRLCERRRDEYAAATKNTIIAIIIGTSIALFISFLIARLITGQTDQINQVFDAVERADLDTRCAISTGDELGEVAHSLNATLDQLRATVNRAEELAANQKAENLRIQADVQRFLSIVQLAAGGDFTVEAAASDGDIGVLAKSFNVMVADLSSIISKVNESASRAAVSTQEIQVSSQQMARGAEDQAMQIANTSSAIEEMAVSIRRVAENADSAAGASQQAWSVASEGGQTVSESISHMFGIRDTVQDAAERIRALGESSLEIGEIVKVINNIASRTNLLALNATIEAAKAGESGRGFAVVADEVRKLADQSSKASNDIAILIQGIQSDTAEAVRAMENTTKDVAEGVHVAERSGKSLERIVTQVDHTKELISEITMAAKQQAKASDAIVESMSEINRIARQAALATSQTSEATRDLLSVSEDLRNAVLAFKLKR